MSIDYSVLAIPKGPTRKRINGRKHRAEKSVAAKVRAQCFERDGACRICNWEQNPEDWHSEGIINGQEFDGPEWAWQTQSEWSHMHARRRSKTRGMEPTERHDARYSLMLCRTHHRLYDAKRILITALTRKGANGLLKFRMAK